MPDGRKPWISRMPPADTRLSSMDAADSTRPFASHALSRISNYVRKPFTYKKIKFTVDGFYCRPTSCRIQLNAKENATVRRRKWTRTQADTRVPRILRISNKIANFFSRKYSDSSTSAFELQADYATITSDDRRLGIYTVFETQCRSMYSML